MVTADGTTRPVPAGRRDVAVVRCGADLVALSERFYGGVFAGAVIFVGLAAIAALALLPIRTTGPLERLTPAVVIAVLIVALVPLVVWRAGATYRLLRMHPLAELALVLAAAALIVYPLRSELWWPSCALLMLLATFVPARRAIAYCVAVLAANFAAHVVAADLDETPPVTIIGLWIGYLSWTAAFALVTERLAAYVLRLNASRVEPRQPAVRVPSWRTEKAVEPAGELTVAEAPRGLDRLTARQLQVVALLTDGLRYRDVAACLSISVRQVERHVAQATARLGVKSVYELVAVAIREGLVPAGDRPREPSG